MPKEESFPVPLKFFDVTRTTFSSPDVMLEQQTEDVWDVDGEKELSDAWIGFTRFVLPKGKATGMIFMVQGETYTEQKNFSS